MKHILMIGFIISASLACSPAKEKPEQVPATPDVVALHDEAMARVHKDFLDAHYIVSLKPDGHFEHKGDSLLWTSLLIASSTCAENREVEMTLQRSILMGNGQLRRHYQINDASLDGAIGLFRAVAKRIRLGCAQGWKEPLQVLKDYADSNHGAINEHSSAGLDAHDYVLRALLDRLSGGSDGNFDSGARDLLTGLMASWSQGVQLAYNLWSRGIIKEPKAAFRSHLGLLTFETLEDLGISIPDSSRNKFCASTAKFDMPTIDHWCGRTPIADWIPTFQHDIWEMRHQRAALWETPDGNGLRTPGIDLLYAIAQGYIL